MNRLSSRERPRVQYALPFIFTPLGMACGIGLATLGGFAAGLTIMALVRLCGVVWL